MSRFLSGKGRSFGRGGHSSGRSSNRGGRGHSRSTSTVLSPLSSQFRLFPAWIHGVTQVPFYLLSVSHSRENCTVVTCLSLFSFKTATPT